MRSHTKVEMTDLREQIDAILYRFAKNEITFRETADCILRAIVDGLGITENVATPWFDEGIWVVTEETADALRTLYEAAYGEE